MIAGVVPSMATIMKAMGVRVVTMRRMIMTTAMFISIVVPTVIALHVTATIPLLIVVRQRLRCGHQTNRRGSKESDH
jgi:type II secretory pathway component PulF